MNPSRLILLFILCLAAPARGVQPGEWKHTSEADFRAGTLNNVISTPLGELKLGRATTLLSELDPRVSAVHSLLELAPGRFIAGTAPEGILYQRDTDRAAVYARLEDDSHILCLGRTPDGGILAGTGGSSGRVVRLDQDGRNPRVLFSHPQVQYVWCMVVFDDGSLCIGTGPNGLIFEIDPAGKSRVILDSEELNILCVAADDGGRLLVGTDPGGLVCRVDRATGALFVLFDAAESEITSILKTADGSIYASGSQVASEPVASEARKEQTGRPEPSPVPADPTPPVLPDPIPREPAPEPNAASDRAFRVMPAMYQAEEEPLAAEPEAQEPAAPLATPIPASPAPDPSTGSAVYKIDRQGLVHEVVRVPEMIHAVVEKADGSLLICTGSNGELYELDRRTDEMTMVVRTDSREVLTVLPLTSGELVLGLANVGHVAITTSGLAASGTFVSPVLDAGQVSRFGRMSFDAEIPDGTAVTVATRSGNVGEEASPGWSDWSTETPVTAPVVVSAPPGRFLQYRLTLKGDGVKTPVVREATVAYQTGNLPPKVSSVQVTPVDPDAVEGRSRRTVTWESVDPNGDPLRFTISARNSPQAPWITIRKNLTEPSFEWDTSTVGDGRYELRIEASDATSNDPATARTAARVSDPFVVDNSAPRVVELSAVIEGNRVRLRARVEDEVSNLRRLEYVVNSGEVWQSVAPLDMLPDSPVEDYAFELSGVDSGPLQVTVRAIDTHGNAGYRSITVHTGG
jgi:hypothetical protein